MAKDGTNRGAKEKLTKEGIKRAVELKKGGALDKDIAAALCVTPSTFSTWLNNPKSDNQKELAKALKKAEADYKNALLEQIQNAGQKDWKALAWLLERKYPEEFGRVDRINANIQAETKNEVNIIIEE